MLPPVYESPAAAGSLKNSVRVGDRSRMHIVRAPAPGQTKRVVIDHNGPRIVGTPRAARPSGRARPDSDWFWARHRADGRASPKRWADTLASLRTRRAPIVDRALLKRVGERYRRQIAEAASRHRLSEALILAVIAVESAGRPAAVSSAGARGLMQLIPATAQRFGVADSFDPVQNIAGGAAYLDWLLDTFDGDILLALAGYNAGEGAVMKHKGVPPYAETRDYVVKVMDALLGAEPLCQGGLAGPRRPCDWAVADAS